MVCVSDLQSERYGEMYMFASTLCKCDLRKSVLFVRSWARVLICDVGGVCSILLFCDMVVFIVVRLVFNVFFWNGVWVSDDVCCVSSIVECGFFLDYRILSV